MTDGTSATDVVMRAGESAAVTLKILGGLSATITAAPDPLDGATMTRNATAEGELCLPPRYRDEGRIACGSFGEVRRVYDTKLERTVAMKSLRADVAATSRLEARFLQETKLTAGLEHPGIVAVHDVGRLDDGRLWFTMREVRGRTFGEVIAEVHSAPDATNVHEPPNGWTFRRLVDAFARVCQAVAYAHRRGVVHRDLKPDNLMIGELGEVMVMDWGLGRRIDSPENTTATSPPGERSCELSDSDQHTRHGDVLGTPAYMPPEQAMGLHELHGLPSDVYALGAVLYHLLTGRPPYQGPSAAHVLARVRAGSPTRIVDLRLAKPIPAELIAICEQAMAREIQARHPHAEALAQDVVAWLDGARRREQALEKVARARAIEPEIRALREMAMQKRARAQVHLEGVRPFDPIEKKESAWVLEDEAHRLELTAIVHEAQWLETLQSALTVDPDLSEAHTLLADHHAARLLAAERAHNEADAIRAEAQLQAHDQGRHAALLRGEGALTLVTDPPGAVVTLEKYVARGRRLVTEDMGIIGHTPLRAIPMLKGSYRLRIRAQGRTEVSYPVWIERGAHWDGIAPGQTETQAIRLPLPTEMDADECYIPAGWTWIGGDPKAADGLPQKRIWVDGFVLGRFPVTSAEYLDFLNDLVASGDEEQARAVCPRRELGPSDGLELVPVFRREPFGMYVLPSDWDPAFPVVQIGWHAAWAYARWLSRKTGRAIRLPNELEREKAARGVDGRVLPWGNHVDATFACALESHQGPPTRVPITTYPIDESPYGVRGLAGNVRDWCLNVWKINGPVIQNQRLSLDPAAIEDPDFRVIRGGAWGSAMATSHAASRFGGRPERWTLFVGMRIARSFP